MDFDDSALDQVPIAGRSLDIEIGADLVSVDLDNLDPDPNDIIELLKEANSNVWVWTRVAGEYWRKGMKNGAEQVVRIAKSFMSNRATSSMWPLYAFEANTSLSEARTAPKFVLHTAKRDVIGVGTQDKEQFYKAMAQSLNQTEAGREDAGDHEAFQTMTALTRSLYLVSKKALDEALQGFEGVLAVKPTNIPALLGKARIQFVKREHQNALQIFSKVLQLNPRCKPDPRIGIGLCFWVLGNHEKARAAWQRSVEVSPDEWASHAMLGIDYINESKDTTKSDEERAEAYAMGTRHVQKSFKANNKGAAAANALSEFFFRKGDLANALKLAERAVQYADTMTLLTEGNFRVARVHHSEGNFSLAAKHYQQAAEGQQKHLLSSLGVAQINLQSSEVAAAIHRLDALAGPSTKPQCLEASIMLASLRTNPRPGVSSADIALDKKKSREMFDSIVRIIDNNECQANEGKFLRNIRNLGDDKDMWVEIARLWQQENSEKTERALKEALRVIESAGQTEPRIVNNLAVLRHLEGDLDLARTMYEESLASLAASSDTQMEEVSTTILYNLARVYEAQDNSDLAKEAYTKLLSRHPEYVDARIRQAQMLKDVNQTGDANELLSRTLSSQGNNLNLRAYYTYFLCQSNQMKLAKELVFTTLKNHDKHDLYALCAAGFILYQQARESKEASSEAVKARRRNFERAVEFYDKALMLDPTCAVAAQGLAIVSADDALGTLSGITTADDSTRRAQGMREALDVFAKVRETLSDGSVYANMGHCYYARDEFERALECYETASKKFYGQRNAPVLLCLSRTNYAKANKDQSYSHMELALHYAQRALHLTPSDKSISYNIAMIEQKAAEILFSLDPSKRTLQELRKGIEHAEHAQSMFASLASDPSTFLPYSRDLADQRRKYGESILRKADEHLATQEAYEQDVQQKLDAARQRRMDEKERLENLERERARELQAQAEALAEKRRLAREEALAWSNAVKAESDEEREKKKRSRKAKVDGEVLSGDEGEGKKKRRAKTKKEINGNGELVRSGEVPSPLDDEDAVFSGAENEKPKKRNTKKRVVRDDDDEDGTTGPRKKLIKSKEVISDSDEDMD